MTSTDIAPPSAAPTTQQLAAKTRSKPLRVTGKLKSALDLMVWGDDDATAYAWDDAARKVALTLRAMRYAMERQHVRAYLKTQRHVFLESACARNPRRLVELRDQDDNRTAAVASVRQLEDMAEQRSIAASSRVTQPGVTIHINLDRSSRDADKGMIEINPLSEHDNLTPSE